MAPTSCFNLYSIIPSTFFCVSISTENLFTFFTIAISQLIKTFPDHEKYDLVSQMRRSSRSVTYNIAEGYGRFNFKENAHYIRISRGSIYELLDQLIVAYDEGYITQSELEKYKKMIEPILKLLNGLVVIGSSLKPYIWKKLTKMKK